MRSDGSFRTWFTFNDNDASRLWIAGSENGQTQTFDVTAAEVVEAVDTGAIKRLTPGRSKAALREIKKLKPDHAMCHVRDAARAHKHAVEALAKLDL